MVKMHMDVNLYDQEFTRITRELNLCDKRSLECRAFDMITEIPRDQKELESLVALYKIIHIHSPEMYRNFRSCARHVKPEHICTVEELPDNYHDLYYSNYLENDEYANSGVERLDRRLFEYRDFEREMLKESAEKYRAWQQKRMGNHK
jgi:hypothetical protein